MQDGDNNATMTQFLGNMPMYDTTHKLHKGIDNTLRFKFRDTDRKSVDLTGKTVIWKMYERMFSLDILQLQMQQKAWLQFQFQHQIQSCSQKDFINMRCIQLKMV